jgi:hypothetical protein
MRMKAAPPRRLEIMKPKTQSNKKAPVSQNDGQLGPSERPAPYAARSKLVVKHGLSAVLQELGIFCDFEAEGYAYETKLWEANLEGKFQTTSVVLKSLARMWEGEEEE